jgi:glucose-1-phosphatase
MSVKALLFDLGRVLIDFDHRRAAAAIAGFTRKSPEEIYEMFFDSKLTRMFEEGKLEPEAFYGKIKQRLRLKLRYEQFVPMWDEIFFLTPENREVHALAQKLRGHYSVSLLTNINALHLAYIREHFPVFDAFDRVFASCELGLAKPDPRIYSRVLKELGAKPGEAFYTDDRPELIAQARIMGIRAFVYTGPAQLVQDLGRCGISVPQ